MSVPDPDGQLSLMLCESILHILVEEGVISKEKALEAIDGVVELGRENEIGRRRSSVQITLHYTLEELMGRQVVGVVNFPAKRIGTEEDMAGAAIYLASRAGDYVLGSTLVVDGGVTCAR